jgi:hypothetical protein
MDGLSSAHEVLVALALRGGPEYNAQMKLAAENTGLFGKALLTTSAQMKVATERTWLHNQALFTARRYAFYATLAITGLAYEVFKLGMSYNNTVNTARVALKGMFPDPKQMQGVIDQLYQMSTFSPFLFKDTLTAFRVMAPAMKNAGISTSLTLKTMQASMDALAESGKSTPANLNRISTQLQHMANIGRPTGQVLLALARDGLPVYPALRKELHLTGNALEQVAGSGLTAKQVIQALNKFIETSPVYSGQAFKQGTKTLQGNWQMFKDILAQAAGSTTGGLFSGLEKRLKAINVALRPDLMKGKPIGLTEMAQAIDKSLTPSTHIIINLFNIFTTAIKTVMLMLQGFFLVIRGFLWIPDKLTSLFGANNLASKLLGGSIGILIGLFFLAKIAIMPFIAAIELWNAVARVAKTLAIAYRVTMFLLNGEWALATALVTGNTAATEANAVATTEDAFAIDIRTGSIITGTAAIEANAFALDTMTLSTQVTTVAVEEATVAATLFGTALDLMLGPIGLVLVGLILLIKYHKQIANWRPIAGITSFVQHPLRGIHNIKKHPGHAGHSLLDFLFPEIMGARSLYNRPSGGGLFDNPFGSGGILHFQHGGTMGRPGWAMVGEGGPEMVHLPGGAKVHPLNEGDGGSPFVVKVYPQNIYLDGKKFATVMATAITDKEARS